MGIHKWQGILRSAFKGTLNDGQIDILKNAISTAVAKEGHLVTEANIAFSYNPQSPTRAKKIDLMGNHVHRDTCEKAIHVSISMPKPERYSVEDRLPRDFSGLLPKSLRKALKKKNISLYVAYAFTAPEAVIE